MHISITFEFDLDLIVIDRQVYSILDWLGDVGGLNQGLLLIAQLMVSPVSTLALRLQLTSLAKSQTPIKGSSFKVIKLRLLYYFCNWRKQREERRWLEKLHRQVMKELDLIKILKRQRALITATFALLSEA